MNTLNFVKPVELGYYKLYSDVENLTRGTEDSACFDVRAYFGTHEREVVVYNNQNVKLKYHAFKNLDDDPFFIMLHPGDRAMIPTGIILDIPQGYSVRVHPRSGVALKQGVSLCNSQGIVDSDYVEPFFATLINFSNTSIRIDHGMRIAQLELVQHPAYIIKAISAKPSQKTSRAGGFGSTGTK